jgi:hypothetical protein
MKELEIVLLEKITNGTLDKNNMLRRLLFLYGVAERYFYHYSYTSINGNINTNELIECTKHDYNKIISNKRESELHKPVKYISNNIPTNKILRAILYAR